MVRTHPVTGRKALFVNRIFTTRIDGLKQARERRDARDAVRPLRDAGVPVPLRLAPNSIAFWDNRCGPAHAMWDYFPHTRSGYRVTVKGDKPFFQA